MTTRYCNKMRCYVGPHFCSLCKVQDCNDKIPLPPKEKTYGKQEPTATGLERLHKRGQAFAMVERELKATDLYESTGFTILPDCEQHPDVSPGISSEVAVLKTEKLETIDTEIPTLENELEYDAVLSNVI